MTFVVACKNFFGLKPGQSILQFAQEIKKLTPKDKQELAPLLSKELGEEVEVTAS